MIPQKTALPFARSMGTVGVNWEISGRIRPMMQLCFGKGVHFGGTVDDAISSKGSGSYCTDQVGAEHSLDGGKGNVK